MYTVYLADTPNGQKISIALEELELSYERIHVNLSAGEQLAPDFLAISPNNKIPALIDHARKQSIFESGAILLHLAERHGRLLPHDPAQRLEALQWLFLQVGSIGPMLGQLWWFRHASPTPNPQALERYTKEAERLFGVFERRLAQQPWLGGAQYGIADIASFPWMRTHGELGLAITAWPHVQQWLQRIEQRPAALRGLAAAKELA